MHFHLLPKKMFFPLQNSEIITDQIKSLFSSVGKILLTNYRNEHENLGGRPGGGEDE